MPSSQNAIAVIGAGPYGLAAAAHLSAAGFEVHPFGEPMEFWDRFMPKGMCLRSSAEASRISDPAGDLTTEAFARATMRELQKPIPLADFVDYGKWFQQASVPNVDRRRIKRIELGSNGFRLLVDDGDTEEVERVVVAGGIARFAYRPPEYSALDSKVASHTIEHRDLSCFAGQRVIVIGGGQSATESAALLSEQGADVELIMRAPELNWVQFGSWLRNRRWSWVHGVMYPVPRTEVGPPGLNRIVGNPELFRRLPLALQQRIARRSIRPAAAGWLRPRLANVRLTAKRRVESVSQKDGSVHLQLSDGSTRVVEHVLLATGYRVDVSRYEFLGPDLLDRISRVDGYPVLGPGFESSVPRLHFLGAPAARSFGPLTRFVSGTWYSAPALTRRIVESRG